MPGLPELFISKVKGLKGTSIYVTIKIMMEPKSLLPSMIHGLPHALRSRNHKAENLLGG